MTDFSGPLPSEGIVRPASMMAFDPKTSGYVEHEFLVAGTASGYAVTGEAGGDGKWAAETTGTASFRTRVVVRYPADQGRFSGTLLVEWLNVSSGFDADPDWTYTHPEILTAGHAWAGVSAQEVGVVGGEGLLAFPGAPSLGLRGTSPERYGTLEHPGDQYSFDIFGQIALALRGASGPAQATHGEADVPVLGGLRPARVLAIGESQSAFYLTSYINAVHPLHPFVDGFFVHSRGGGAARLDGKSFPRDGVTDGVQIRSDNNTPVLTLEAESDLLQPLVFGLARQPDSDWLRVWEMAGTSHADKYMIGLGAALLGCDWEINDGPHRFVAQAAMRALDRWVRDGVPPGSAAGIELTSVLPPLIARDTHGIALGGVRTPGVDVPAAVLSGEGPPGSGPLGWLVGSTTPLDSQDLLRLYGSRSEYLARYAQALEKAIAAGFLLPEHRDELIAEAEAVAFPGG
jgi:Alpha/beta hydrolase domain